MHDLYLKKGDDVGVNHCLSLIAEIPGMLEAADAQVSRLGRMINEQADLTLPPRYISWIKKYILKFVSDS